MLLTCSHRWRASPWRWTTWPASTPSVVHPAPSPRRRQAREGAFSDELTLELGQGPEHVEDQPTTGGAGVDRLREAHERHPTSLQVPDALDEVLEGPSEAVESPDHDGVPRSSLGEQVV